MNTVKDALPSARGGLSMAKADTLKQLFRAFTEGDDAAFIGVAHTVIEDARNKKHTTLARELEEILVNRPIRAGNRRSPVVFHGLPRVELLKRLFSAHARTDDREFFATANQIISEELAANRLSQAQMLRQALGSPSRRPGASEKRLTQVPKERRYGSELVTVSESLVEPSQLTLHPETEERIHRVIAEHADADILLHAGLRPKQRLLFWGPPGCGKTKTAKALAYALGLPFALVRVEALMSSYLGETSANLKKLFDFASNETAVILFDEFDSLAKLRDDPHEVGELKRVVNSLLQMFDAFTGDSLLVAASNHQHLIDPAIWRRFDDVLEFPMPTAGLIESHLKVLLNGVHVEGSIAELSHELEGLSFASVEAACKEAVKTMLMSRSDVAHIADIGAEGERLRTSTQATRRSPSLQ